MGSIGELYKSLSGESNSTTVRLAMNEPYPVSTGSVNGRDLFSEALILSCAPSKESFLLASFADGPVKALYQAQTASDIENTMRELNLPDHWPGRLGENVFYSFLSSIPIAYEGPVYAEQAIFCDDLAPFQGVLERLIGVYENRLK
jgi:hypothetical protein